jgi:hypothetical protein
MPDPDLTQPPQQSTVRVPPRGDSAIQPAAPALPCPGCARNAIEIDMLDMKIIGLTRLLKQLRAEVAGLVALNEQSPKSKMARTPPSEERSR